MPGLGDIVYLDCSLGLHCDVTMIEREVKARRISIELSLASGTCGAGKAQPGERPRN